MQRYELSDGTSNKFWAIELDGSGYKVTFGKIGTNGQTQLKSFADAATAQKEHDKLVAEKVKKGYVLAGAQATPVPAPTAPPPKPKPVPPPPVVAATPAPSAGSIDTKKLTKLADEEVSKAAVKPQRAGTPIEEYVGVYNEYLKKEKTSILNGTVHADAEGKRLVSLLTKEFGISKVSDQVSLDAAAAALHLIHDKLLVVGFLFARGGAPLALAAFAATAHPYDTQGVGSGSRQGTTLIHNADRHLQSLLVHRADTSINAHWRGLTDAERAAARPAIDQLRADGTLLQRSLISTATRDSAWVDADLAEHARTHDRAVFSPEALLVATNPADLAAYYAGLADRDAVIHGVAGSHYFIADGHRVTGFHYVQAFGLAGIDIAIARVKVRIPKLTGEPYALARVAQDINALLEVVALAVDYPPGVAVAVAVLDRVTELKLNKADDPKPIALEIITASPALALPLLAPNRKQWAKDLSTRLGRLSGTAPTDDRPDGFLPAGLRGRAFKKPPEFWQPAALPRIAMRDGTLFPVDELGSLAAILVADDRVALDQLRDLADRDSLAKLAWELFQLWLGAGGESKHKWAFVQLGLLGNDDTARRLAPLIRAWPGESQHKRAVNGLDVLGDIGSDVALMMLDGIAQKVKFKALQEHARTKMGEIAGKRGITAEQLSDRLVPDLELEDDGSKTLDFGPRTFRVGFDEHLAPFVIDASGARLRDLPKPNSKDDAALSAAATETWKAMKKDVRALAGIQLTRLELGMGNARRWTAGELRAFFVEHPLMTHLARRLVWGIFAPELTRTFRVAEDRTYATVGDDALDVPDDAEIGIVHRFDLPDADANAWGKLFADYELVQPFEQLGRAVYRLTDAEQRGTSLERFSGRKVATNQLLKLLSRGWRKGDPQDAGMIHELVKPISAELSASLAFENGISASSSREYDDPTQSLKHIDFAASRPYYGYQRKDARALADVDPVLVSEVIRDLETLESVADEEEA